MVRHTGPRPAAALAAVGLLGLASISARGPADQAPKRHLVEIHGMAFHPQELEVQEGDTVIWVNRDLVPHTATSTRKDGWNTGPLQQGESGRYVPRHQGVDRYVCQLHPVMLGRLVVR
jgi:plastocyanin